MAAIEWLWARAEAHRQETGRPLVTLSYAQSLDGSLSARRGSPLALSGEASQRLTHRLRAAQDVILVGIGTVLADDPQLTVRLVEGRNPRPVILDSRLRIPIETNLLTRLELCPWIATLEQSPTKRRTILEEKGAELLVFRAGEDGRIPLPDLLERLAGLGVNRLMVEGGARVITSFLTQGLVDQIVLTISPVFVGGLRAVEELLSSSLDFPRIIDPCVEQLGSDLVIWGKLSR